LLAFALFVGRTCGTRGGLGRSAALRETLLHLARRARLIYILFLLLWGLNYRRVSMPDRLAMDRGAHRPTKSSIWGSPQSVR
jgi:hypothetical protein